MSAIKLKVTIAVGKLRFTCEGIIEIVLIRICLIVNVNNYILIRKVKI